MTARIETAVTLPPDVRVVQPAKVKGHTTRGAGTPPDRMLHVACSRAAAPELAACLRGLAETIERLGAS